MLANGRYARGMEQSSDHENNLHTMRNIPIFLLCVLCCLGNRPGPGDDFPRAEISNGIIHAGLYLPDTARGYYRGTRFDWSGVMPSLEYKEHTYAGQWFENYSPTLHEAVMGPVEAFAPVGFETAGAGGAFVAIGIGLLSRPDASPYTPFHYYKIIDPGKWQIRSGSDQITFVHTLKAAGCSYVYSKTLLLVKDKPELVITHRLRNTGDQMLETEVYDHNLFLIDHQPVGPGLVLSFPFPLTGKEERGIGSLAEFRDNQIGFLQELTGKESAYAVLGGYGSKAADYTIKMENHHTGAGLKITSDQPLSKLVFWCCATTACPEPYIRIKIRPGKAFDWSLTYTFYECSIDHK
jgi:hypothetical protein